MLPSRTGGGAALKLPDVEMLDDAPRLVRGAAGRKPKQAVIVTDLLYPFFDNHFVELRLFRNLVGRQTI